MASDGIQPLRCTKKTCKGNKMAVGLRYMKIKCTTVECACAPLLSLRNIISSHCLEWVRTPGNYSSYRGNKFGRSKSQIQKEIAEKINAAGAAMGLDRQRDKRQVNNKIRYIERKFKEVYEWVNKKN